MGQFTEEWVVPSVSALCKDSREDNQHLFLGCSFTTLVWLRCASLFGLQINIAEGSNIWARFLMSRSTSGKVTQIV